MSNWSQVVLVGDAGVGKTHLLNRYMTIDRVSHYEIDILEEPSQKIMFQLLE